MSLKSLIQKILPKKMLSLYHWSLAHLANIYYGTPSKKMLVIGITGTKGKTSTANFIWSVLQSAGIKTGIISTANIRIGEKEFPNPYHMTMPGRFKVQKFLKQMLYEGCQVVIVETTSQGLIQHRHIGIHYDIVIFTNLFPEHIDAHGSFENYKKAKGILFKYLTAHPQKIINGKKHPKIIITNADSEHSEYFGAFKADQKFSLGILNGVDSRAEDILEKIGQVSFRVGNLPYTINISGRFNVYNALPAILLGKLFGIDEKGIQTGFDNLKVIPGRMEEINEGQDFRVFVDYAHEKESLTNALKACRVIAEDNKVIVIIGAEGGGRDKSKGPQMGKVACELADIVVVSTTDPYDDDPAMLAKNISDVCVECGKKNNDNLFVVLDRREAINKALSLAKAGDVVLTTAMGAQQNMIVKGKKLWWDERVVVREELKKIKK